MKIIQPQLNSLKRMMEVAKEREDQMALIGFANRQRELFKSVGYRMSPMFGNLIVGLAFNLGSFLGARRLATLDDSPFKEGGALWFTDLTAPDWYLSGAALPALVWFMRVSRDDHTRFNHAHTRFVEELEGWNGTGREGMDVPPAKFTTDHGGVHVASARLHVLGGSRGDLGALLPSRF